MAEAATASSSLTTVRVSTRDEAYNRACSVGTIKELEEQYNTRNAQMERAFDQMGDEMNIGKITEFGDKTPAQVTEAFITLHSELTGIGDALKERESLKAHKEQILQARASGDDVDPTGESRIITNLGSPEWQREGSLYTRNDGQRVRYVPLNSELFWENMAEKGIDSPEKLKEAANTKQGIEMSLSGFKGMTVLNTVFMRSDGWDPQIIRERGWVESSPQRPTQIIDIVPSRPTTQSGVTFMQETEFANDIAGKNAGAVNEGAAIGEGQFKVEEKTEKVQKYGLLLAVTEEQLEDVEEVNAYLNDRLPLAVMQKVDEGVLNGNGAAPNIRGFYQTAGVQALNMQVGADANKTPTQPFKDVFRAVTLCRLNGRTRPSHAVMHQSMWEQIVLAELDANGYFFGNPQEGYMPRAWGLPVVETDIIGYAKGNTAGMVGDFRMYSVIRVKRDLSVVVGLNDTDFAKDQMTYKATVRICLVVYRPKAFVKMNRAG